MPGKEITQGQVVSQEQIDRIDADVHKGTYVLRSAVTAVSVRKNT